jgi:hypothetical protein
MLRLLDFPDTSWLILLLLSSGCNQLHSWILQTWLHYLCVLKTTCAVFIVILAEELILLRLPVCLQTTAPSSAWSKAKDSGKQAEKCDVYTTSEKVYIS